MRITLLATMAVTALAACGASPTATPPSIPAIRTAAAPRLPDATGLILTSATHEHIVEKPKGTFNKLVGRDVYTVEGKMVKGTVRLSAEYSFVFQGWTGVEEYFRANINGINLNANDCRTYRAAIAEAKLPPGIDAAVISGVLRVLDSIARYGHTAS